VIYPATNPKLADAIMETVITTANAVGLRHYVIAGALLGWYRDNQYIPWDNDLDIGVYYEPGKYEDFLVRLITMGFLTDIGDEWEGKHLWRYGMLADMVFLEPTSGGAKFYEHPTTLYHAKYLYPVPSPTEDYLEWKYGPDWRVPKKKGEYEFQHGG